jgi:hypothetical protein
VDEGFTFTMGEPTPARAEAVTKTFPSSIETDFARDSGIAREANGFRYET